ncbi:MAG: hypothetical protein WD801_11560 [Gemmatimonadaceae bacterium]
MAKWDGGCGVCVRSDMLPDYCEECGQRELELCALYENMRRLESWAEQHGTRRRLAEALVKAFEKHGLGSRAEHHLRWAFLWEMTGDHRDLQKLVERLMPVWKNRVVVTDPIMMKPLARQPYGH